MTSELIVTRDGIPCADQAAALEEFKARCRKETPMTQEHIITREMLIYTLNDVIKERDTARRLLEQTTQDYSTTLSANNKLREENEKLASENATLERSKGALTAEILRLHNELHVKEMKAIDNASGSTLRAIENDETETQRKRWEGLKAERNQLYSQLPDGMKHCSIRFHECENGHGMLTADNWVKHPCPWCKLNKLRELFENNIHSCEMLMSNPPKNLVAHRGLEIIGE